ADFERSVMEAAGQCLLRGLFSSESGGMVDELPRQAELFLQMRPQRPHSPGFGGVVPCEDQVDSPLHRVEVGVVCPLACDEGIDAVLDRSVNCAGPSSCDHTHTLRQLGATGDQAYSRSEEIIQPGHQRLPADCNTSTDAHRLTSIL